MVPPNPLRLKSGLLAVDVQLDGRAGADFAQPQIDIDAKAKLTDVTGSIKEPSAAFSRIKADLTATARLNKDMSVTDVKTNLVADGAAFEMKNKVKSAPFKINLTAYSPNPAKSNLDGSVRIISKSITTDTPEGQVHFPVDIKGSAKVDMAAGRYTAKNIDVKAGALATLKGAGKYNESSKKFDIDLDIKKLDSAKIFNLLPDSIKKSIDIDMVSGLVTGKIAGAGVVPAALPTNMLSLPFKASLDMKVKDGKFVSLMREIELDGLEVDVLAGVSKSKVFAQGGLWLEKAVLKKITGDSAIDPMLEFDLAFENGNRLLINRLSFETPELGIVETLEGHIGGINVSAFTEPQEGHISPVHDLDISLENFVSITLEKSRDFLTDITAFGEVDTLITIDARPGESVDVVGESDFKNLLLTKEGTFVLSKLSGRFPFSKTLTYLTQKDSANSGAKITVPSFVKELRETSFFEDIRRQSADRDNITIEAVQVGPVDMRKTVFDLFFKDTSFGLDYLRTTLLGGGLAGTVQIKGEKNKYTFRTSEVFAGLDFSKLTKKGSGTQRKGSRDRRRYYHGAISLAG